VSKYFFYLLGLVAKMKHPWRESQPNPASQVVLKAYDLHRLALPAAPAKSVCDNFEKVD
jgi:hypothetical protein